MSFRHFTLIDQEKDIIGYYQQMQNFTLRKKIIAVKKIMMNITKMKNTAGSRKKKGTIICLLITGMICNAI